VDVLELSNSLKKKELEEIQRILTKLEDELERNKFGDLERETIKDRETALAKLMTPED